MLMDDPRVNLTVQQRLGLLQKAVNLNQVDVASLLLKRFSLSDTDTVKMIGACTIRHGNIETFKFLLRQWKPQDQGLCSSTIFVPLKKQMVRGWSRSVCAGVIGHAAR